ncbi:hypothetical protein ACOSB0_00080, partial [Candidatus Phytoplasma citri]
SLEVPLNNEVFVLDDRVCHLSKVTLLFSFLFNVALALLSLSLSLSPLLFCFAFLCQTTSIKP